MGRGAGLFLGPSPGLLQFLLGSAGGLATSSERLDTIMRPGARRESSQRHAQREGNEAVAGEIRERAKFSAREGVDGAGDVCTVLQAMPAAALEASRRQASA